MNTLTKLFFPLIFICLSSPTHLQGCCWGISEIVIPEKLKSALERFNEACDEDVDSKGLKSMDPEAFDILRHPDYRDRLRDIYTLAKKLPKLASRGNYKKFEAAFEKFESLGVVRLNKVPLVGKTVTVQRVVSESFLFGISTHTEYKDCEEFIPFPYKKTYEPVDLYTHDALADIYSALRISSRPKHEKEGIRQLLAEKYGIAAIEAPLKS